MRDCLSRDLDTGSSIESQNVPRPTRPALLNLVPRLHEHCGSGALSSGPGDGIIHTMKTTIDSAGRIVIPKEIRKQAGLAAGMPLEVSWRDGIIEIEPTYLPVALERRGRFLVAVPQQDVPALTTEIVERTRRAVRGEEG
jgi:AbrB family looped-hinge helix DNA binding protein